MADNEQAKEPLLTGDQPGEKKTQKSTKKSSSKKGEKKGDKPKGKSFEENKIRDSETARERGRNGGLKSAEVKKAKKDARESIQYLLGQMTKNAKIRENLTELGVEESEFTNMIALHGRLFSMAMSGNIEAYLTLMKMGGYEPEETRKERESIAADQRRNVELEAKVAALGQGVASEVAVSLPDEDGDNDVVIYMPQIDSEESCEMEPESPAVEDSVE